MLWGPATDHVLILSILEFAVPQATKETKHNYCEVDWEMFNERLETELDKIPDAQPLVTDAEF